MNYIQILYLCILKQLGKVNQSKIIRCELHSNLVSLHSETTRHNRRNEKRKLWITFKSCIFAFWNNCFYSDMGKTYVVNYIQILYLCILKQHRNNLLEHLEGCELHSNLVSLHSETTSHRTRGYGWSCELHSNLVSLHSETTHKFLLINVQVLWITFKSCIFAFWNNIGVVPILLGLVVNYIQILYLCILKQRCGRWFWRYNGCELHSNLVSLHSETTRTIPTIAPLLLWITFKSCIFAFWNNNRPERKKICFVVNYIQILYLCILKQPSKGEVPSLSSCELHSNLVSLHSETTSRNCSEWNSRLWITFKSCIFAFWNNQFRKNWGTKLLWITFKSCIFAFWNNIYISHSRLQLVVNYIQILYLCILKQLDKILIMHTPCCELHSNLVSLHSETTRLSLWP